MRKILNKDFRLFCVFGINIELNITWFFIFAFLLYGWGRYFSSGIGKELPAFYDTHPYIGWAVALAFTTLVFSSLLLYELAHSLLARRFGGVVKSINFFMLGGVSMIENIDEIEAPKRSFLIAAVGPLTSFLIAGILFGILSMLDASKDTPYPFILKLVIAQLWFVNMVLGAFNLIPAYPMDGGRIYFSFLRLLGVEKTRALRIALGTTTLAAVSMIGGGIFLAFALGSIGSIMLVFLGLFLFKAVRSIRLIEIAAKTKVKEVCRYFSAFEKELLEKNIRLGNTKDSVRDIPLGDWKKRIVREEDTIKDAAEKLSEYLNLLVMRGEEIVGTIHIMDVGEVLRRKN